MLSVEVASLLNGVCTDVNIQKRSKKLRIGVTKGLDLSRIAPLWKILQGCRELDDSI